MEDEFDDEAAFLQQIVDAGYLTGVPLGITKRRIDKGPESLSAAQQAIFDKEVTAKFVLSECERGCEIPWSERFDALDNGGYCSYCQHMKDKFDRE